MSINEKYPHKFNWFQVH